MTANQIFRGYVRFVGVGAIATAGIFGIIKSLRIVAGSFGIAVQGVPRGQGDAEATHRPRHPRDGHPRRRRRRRRSRWRSSSAASTPSFTVLLLGLALTLVFSFFFASVAANAIATVARNPVSGMTMLTIIFSSVVLLRFGLEGPTGMFFVMAIAGMVCTALSVSGQTITDLKTGYWLGSTPAAQQRVKFLGVIAAAVAAGPGHRDAGAGVPVRRGGGGRRAAGAGGAAGVDHEGARRGLHEPPAGGVPAVRRRAR